MVKSALVYFWSISGEIRASSKCSRRVASSLRSGLGLMLRAVLYLVFLRKLAQGVYAASWSCREAIRRMLVQELWTEAQPGGVDNHRVDGSGDCDRLRAMLILASFWGIPRGLILGLILGSFWVSF